MGDVLLGGHQRGLHPSDALGGRSALRRPPRDARRGGDRGRSHLPRHARLVGALGTAQERSIMSSIVYAGTALGTVIFMLVSGLIAASISWEAVFYIEGGVSLIWLILWGIFTADTPQSQTFISEEERDYIVKSLNQGKEDEKLKMPWKAVLTSPAFLAILIAHTCSNWGWYMVLIELPLYMKSVLNYKISENAVLTALPFLCMWLFSMVFSKTLDTLREKKIISTTAARKTATGCASVVPMICFISCATSDVGEHLRLSS
nr:unnamed protein product [Callosobruchus analis]